MSSHSIAKEVSRRRTFAIISHPDAGKTTITEKILLFAGAIQIAGSVKSRKAERHAASDWMEIEKQRGISVASSVMQVEYQNCVINLLDTPGHQDFSEDTYRVLTAVDAALMVIDAANGIEPQTRRLLEVCAARKTPVITFINKLDRESQQPLDLIAEIEEQLQMEAIPLNWPVGMGKNFAGVFNTRKNRLRLFETIQNRRDVDASTGHFIEGIDNPELLEKFPDTWPQAHEEIELIQAATPDLDRQAFLSAQQTPILFGSAIHSFGIQDVLDTLVELAPPPGARDALERTVEPDEPKFTGMVFKVQANMDPAHRDRVAFVRVSSGRFSRGMKLRISRTGKEIRPNNVVSFLSQRRDLVEDAVAGDIIGIPNHGVLHLGDVLTEGESLQFTGLPFFAPELFQAVEVRDPLKSKQLRMGLTQLGEEGAIQVFRPQAAGGALLLGAVGVLQFEVVAHRLKTEYGVDAQMIPSRYNLARWVSAKDSATLRKFVEQNAANIAYDVVDAPAFLASSQAQLRVVQERHPDVSFHTMREHSGKVFN